MMISNLSNYWNNKSICHTYAFMHFISTWYERIAIGIYY